MALTAVLKRSFGVSVAVNEAKIAKVPIGSIVAQRINASLINFSMIALLNLRCHYMIIIPTLDVE